jgi:hypothetical protein
LNYFEGAQGLLDLCSILPGAQGLPAFLSSFLSIFLDEGAQGLLGAQGLEAAWAAGAPDRLLRAWGMGATIAAASARAGRAWDNLMRDLAIENLLMVMEKNKQLNTQPDACLADLISTREGLKGVQACIKC